MARDGITTEVSERTGRTSYRARISFVDGTGKRVHRSRSFRTKRAAEKWRRGELAKLDTGTYHEPAPVTLGVIADMWLRTIERGRAPSTYLQYATTYHRHIAPPFAARKIGSINATDVQTLYDALGREYRAETVKTVHKVLRGIMRHAVADGLIVTNVTDGRRLPTDRRDQPRLWTPDQLRQFLAAIDPDDDALLYQVLATTGMRIGEAIGLKWDVIDLENATAHIRRTLQHTTGGWVIGDATKTDTSVRTIMLPSRAVRALERQRDRDLPGDVVFCDGDGRPLRPQRVRDRLDALCEDAGVPRVTPHDFRRICATLMARQGVHVNAAARQLGHNVGTMLQLYAEVQPDMQVAAATAIDDALKE